jgi:hypothetical protein
MRFSDLRVWSGVGLLLTLLWLAAACSSGAAVSNTGPASSSSIPDEGAPAGIQTVAEPILDNILTSLYNQDYGGFSRDFGQLAKNALNQAAFATTYAQLTNAVGTYQSRDYVGSSDQGGALTVLYIGEFTKEPAGVSITIVLQAVNGTYLVQGLSFDSPNLRGQPLDVARIRSYADSETENALVSLSKNDYTGFSRDLDQAVKNAIPQSDFVKLYNQNKSAIGDYQSKQFESASTQNNILTLRYLAQYSAEPAGVWVTISFDSDNRIGGLFFDSPNLRNAQSK